VTDYKAIFEAVESTLFEAGSRNVPREQIVASLETSKHLEGKRFADDECYRTLVHIVFYSGFKAETVTKKIPIIDEHFPNYRTVSDFDSHEVERIRHDERMIKNASKIRACIENAKTLRGIIDRHGSFQAWLDTLPYPESDREIIDLRNEFRRRFKFLGERTAFHFMTDLGLPVLKPDRVIERIFKRLDLVAGDLEGDKLYVALIQEGRRFAKATGHPIRYIDRVFVAYGQTQTTDMGLDRGICLEANPACRVCGAREYCGYDARRRVGQRARASSSKRGSGSHAIDQVADTLPRRLQYNRAMDVTLTAVYEEVAESDGGGYVAYAEELPGAISEGDTLDEARDNLRDAIELLLEANRELTGKRSPGKKITREKIKVSVA
jgi:DNA-3-methyladenine glycosylase I